MAFAMSVTGEVMKESGFMVFSVGHRLDGFASREASLGLRAVAIKDDATDGAACGAKCSLAARMANTHATANQAKV